MRARLPLEADCEITMEANPGTFEAERFAAYRAAGVNRLSIGVQSFDASKLVALGRIHDREQALAAIALVQRVFDNFNLDLMFGLPSQTLEEARADVEMALAFAPPHLSLYQLTLEPNTVFAKYPPDGAGRRHRRRNAGMDRAADRGGRLPALRSVGLRAGGTRVPAQPQLLALWRLPRRRGRRAQQDLVSAPDRAAGSLPPAGVLPRTRARGEFLAEHVEVARRDLPFEFMLNALRLADGVPAALFTERTGLPASSIHEAMEKAEQRGLIEADPTRIRPTPLGRRFLTDLQALFLPSERT